ncbi:MAG: hypothetical protein R2873_26030 [Caldilineaceae bacterium]
MYLSEVDALIAARNTLRDDGNTVIAVEHDPVLHGRGGSADRRRSWR